MSESRIAPEHASAGRPLIHLSELLRAPVVARSGVRTRSSALLTADVSLCD